MSGSSVPRTRTPPGDGPLWSRVEADLRARIEAREFPDVFPGEHALAAEYGISRHTVREALRRLRQEGLVLAERGRPPRVASDGVIHQPLGALYSLFRSVENSGRTQRSVVRALEVRRDPEVAGLLGLPADTLLTYLDRVRLADDEPLALDQVWLPAARTRGLLAADLTHTALYDELWTRCGVVVAGSTEDIRAVLVDDDRAHLLGVDLPAAALLVTRTGLVADEPFEHRRTLVRSDAFALTAEFSARDGYQLLRSDRRGRPAGPPG
ncbi:GntR family transcriptional regulator [Jannaschia sp. R86511]|uniref:GntR family transcriptional regulator n=1 Tax=Jannaschia sp. R86511 TaxID=3093853 RepID=UPI0036D390C8